MKKLKNIYNKIISVENLYQAAYMAARGRRYRDTTADFNFNLEEEIQRLRKELEMKTYRHGKYRVFTIFEPKERRISAAPFRDRVVHHAVHDVIEPMIDKTFIHDSYANFIGKAPQLGHHLGRGKLDSLVGFHAGDDIQFPVLIG